MPSSSPDFAHPAVTGLFRDVGHSSARGVLERLDRAGIDPNVRDPQGMTLLMTAAMNGHAAHVDALIDRCDAALTDNLGMTALLWAVASNSLSCVERLASAPGHDHPASDGCTALMLAASNHDDAMVNAVLPLSDPNAVNHQGWTALMCAASKNRAYNVARLLPLSDPNVRDSHHRCAWLLAARQAATESLAVLGRHVATNVVDASGMTALMLVLDARNATERQRLEAMKVVLPVSDACAVNAAGQTALEITMGRSVWTPVPALLAAMPRAQTMAIHQTMVDPKASQARALRRLIDQDVAREQQALRDAMGTVPVATGRPSRRPRL